MRLPASTIILFVVLSSSILVAHIRFDKVEIDPQQPAPKAEIAKDPCWDSPVPPSLAYPRDAYTSQQIAEMFQRPNDSRQLLENLKIAFDRNLLADPRFFHNAVLLQFFNGTRLKRLTPEGRSSGSDPAIPRGRTSLIQIDGPFADTEIDVGFTQKCFPDGPHAPNAAANGPYSYQVGAVRLTFGPRNRPDFRNVQDVFGEQQGYISTLCITPPDVTYYGTSPGSRRDTFAYNAIRFEFEHAGYGDLRRTKRLERLNDTDQVTQILLRILEEDGRHPTPRLH